MSMLCEFYKALEYLVSIRAHQTLLYLLELAQSEEPQPQQRQAPPKRTFIAILPPPRVIE